MSRHESFWEAKALTEEQAKEMLRPIALLLKDRLISRERFYDDFQEAGRLIIPGLDSSDGAKIDWVSPEVKFVGLFAALKYFDLGIKITLYDKNTKEKVLKVREIY